MGTAVAVGDDLQASAAETVDLGAVARATLTFVVGRAA